MNQSNKKYLEFFKDSGINYFLQENPRNWFDKTDKIKIKSNKNEDNNKAIKIQNVINKIKNFLQKEYKAITGNSITLSKDGEISILVA